MRVVLASGSPQRRELLGKLGVEFDVVVSDIDEETEGDPAEVVVANAVAKARAVALKLPSAGGPALVIGCDTDVAIDGRLLGKPADERQAAEYLGLLAGREHTVLSGLAIVRPGADGDQVSGIERTSVRFRDLAPDELKRYVAAGEWRGRAGGYAVQGRGSALVEGIEGDLTNVIGLPLRLLLELAPELD